MKNLKTIVSASMVIGIIGAILIVAGCGKGSGDSSTTVQTSIYTVQKGNLTSTVSAVGTVVMPEQAKLTFGTGSSTSSLYTIKEINVAYGDEVKEGDVLASIETSTLESAITEAKVAWSTAQLNLEQASSEATILNAQAAVKNAQANLISAEKALEKLQTSQVADAEDAVKDAQLALDNARLNLSTTNTTVANNITDAEKTVADKQKTYNEYVVENLEILGREEISAQVTELAYDLKKAQDNLDIIKMQGESSIANAEATVTKAEAALKSAEDDLAEMEADNTEMLKQEAAVATAKANLITAQNDLAYIEAGYNIELLQIKVDNAQTTLDTAYAQLDAATIVAPYDGVVAAVNADVGDKVTATQEIIYLVNTGKVEISSSVDETDVASVKKGQIAVVTFDAIDGAVINGTVGAISPVATSSSNVTTYSFSIQVEDTKGYALKEGMTASVEIYVLNRTDILVVPSKAIMQMGPNNIVQVETTEGTTEPRNIQIGDTDGTNTEVVSGLTEGEKVVFQTTSSASSISSNRTPTDNFFMIGGDGGVNIRIDGGGVPPSGGMGPGR